MPPEKETLRAWDRLVRAACVVRTLASVAMAHANVSGQSRKNSTDHKGHNNEPMRGGNQHGNHPKKGPGYHHKYGENAVFRTEECECSLMNVLGDFGHSRFARALGFHPTRLNDHVNEAQDGQGVARGKGSCLAYRKIDAERSAGSGISEREDRLILTPRS